MISPNNSDSFAGPFNEVRAASTAGGGTALTTTAAVIPLLNGTSRVSLIARNFATAVVVKFSPCPWLYLLVGATELDGALVDYSVQAQKPSGTGLSLNALATLPNRGAFYVGSHVPFRGFAVTNSAANANASVMTGEYWNGSAWVGLSITDGTATGGKTMAQTGNVTWTVPAASAWLPDFLSNANPNPVNITNPNRPQAGVAGEHNSKKRYWTRFVVSAALSATVTNSLVMALNRSTAYGEMVQDSLQQFRVEKGEEGCAGIEALTDAGTANLIVNCYTGAKGQFS